MHIDICEPFDVNSFKKEIYFISFIDDYSRYDYVYLLHEKSQAVDILEIYNEIERQLGRKVKVVRIEVVVSIMEDTIKLGNIQIHLLNSFRNVVFVRNTQYLVHHNKMMYQKFVIEL